MFQNFTASSSSKHSKQRVNDLRNLMKTHEIDYYLVPHADEQQNEYLPACAERLSWLTGFSGSAGFAIIGLKEAFIFIDGRYTVQVEDQVDRDIFSPKSLVEPGPIKFLTDILNSGDKVGYDPKLITIKQMQSWTQSTSNKEAELISLPNLIDEIWEDRPPSPKEKIKLHPIEYSGEETANKLKRIKDAISKEACDYLLLTDPASSAWLFNIRGNDFVHNPLAIGYAIIPVSDIEKCMLFFDRGKANKKVKDALGMHCDFFTLNQLEKKLRKISNGNKIHCDPALVSTYFAQIIEKRKGKVVKKRDPVVIRRAIKNEIELDGARTAHIRDGAAMCTFLCWLDEQTPNSVDEIAAVKKLEEIRTKNAKRFNSKLEEISFDTISGAGPNGAIVHYRVSEETNAILRANSLYLVDSGGQYFDGTTDITRTIAIGEPPSSAIEDFTLVLKGHIAIASARFPNGTRGVDLDSFARHALWQKGKDYAHGTGHGVGSYMNVHEGPQSISKKGYEPLRAGMIISNEPGYYKEGEYGIRIENLVITKSEDKPDDDLGMMGFETITLCPIDLRLIDKKLMDETEIDWLNKYHNKVREKLEPHLNSKVNRWLLNTTREI